MSRRNAVIAVALLAAHIVLACVAPALASSGGSRPWEGPLQQIQESITGPVAGAIALAAVAIAGGMLIFGGELNDFARRLVYIVLVAGIGRANHILQPKQSRGGGSWLSPCPV